MRASFSSIVRPAEQLPIGGMYSGGTAAVVLASEGDDERLGARRLQLIGSDGPVIQIGAQPPAQGEMHQLETGRKRPAQHPQICMALAHVVEQGGSGQVGASRSLARNKTCTVEGVPLIGRGLAPEQVCVRVSEQRRHFGLLGRRKWTWAQRPEKTPHEVAEMGHQMKPRINQPTASPRKPSLPRNTMKIRAKRMRKPY